jgi:predicted ATP-grasp superfamily ATP-dependent carboligase
VKVLIVDEGRDRASVAAARALVAGGWTVGVVSAFPGRSLAARTRATAACHSIVHPDEDEEGFVEGVEQLVHAHGYETVFPGWETAVIALSARRERLGFPLGYGRHEGLLTAIDKWSLQPVAREAGLDVPRTVLASAESLGQLDGAVVVKPAVQHGVRASAEAFEDRDAALAHAARIEKLGGRAIAQERLRGRLDAVAFVAGPDGIVAIAQQVAEHVWPQPIGVTARGRSVAVDPQLRTAIERLVAALAWQGLAQLQFLVPADGRPRLIDFNPRFYGSLPLAIRAGVNLPDAWARLATGRPVAFSEGRPGAVYQWFSRDLRASLATPQPLPEIMRCLAISPRAAHTLWSWREPTLAPRFLIEQAGRRIRDRVAGTGGNAAASARLHGAPPTPEVLRAVRAHRVPPWPERARQRIAMKRGKLDYEDDWLEPLLAARRAALGEAADGPPRFLVRVDEFPYSSGYDDPKFGYEASVRFHSTMAEAGVEYLLAVVPQWTHQPLRPDGDGGRPLDDRDLELLERVRGEGVALAQHGATHRTRFSSPRRRSELSGLDGAALGTLLDTGRRRLEEVGIKPRVLVPPFNRFDAAQWPVLAARYDVITGGPESVLTMGFHGGPTWRDGAVYLPCYEPLYEKAQAVLGAAERLLEHGVGTWVPIVLHMGWELDDGFAALSRLARRIAPYAASWQDFLRAVDASRGE